MPLNVTKLQTMYPQFTFRAGSMFRWDPHNLVVEFDQEADEQDSLQLVLHEVGHASLRHTEFDSDLDLIKKEVAAWQYARKACSQLEVEYNENLAESCLDTYRVWIDQRSACPECNETGYQPQLDLYSCINCPTDWSVSADQIKRVCRKVT